MAARSSPAGLIIILRHNWNENLTSCSSAIYNFTAICVTEMEIKGKFVSSRKHSEHLWLHGEERYSLQK